MHLSPFQFLWIADRVRFYQEIILKFEQNNRSKRRKGGTTL